MSTAIAVLGKNGLPLYCLDSGRPNSIQLRRARSGLQDIYTKRLIAGAARIAAIDRLSEINN